MGRKGWSERKKTRRAAAASARPATEPGTYQCLARVFGHKCVNTAISESGTWRSTSTSVVHRARLACRRAVLAATCYWSWGSASADDSSRALSLIAATYKISRMCGEMAMRKGVFVFLGGHEGMVGIFGPGKPRIEEPQRSYTRPFNKPVQIMMISAAVSQTKNLSRCSPDICYAQRCRRRALNDERAKHTMKDAGVPGPRPDPRA